MKPSRILKRPPPEQTVALPRIPSGVLRPLTPSSADSRSLCDSVTVNENSKKNQSYSDNFSEGSWEYYRNNFFSSMIPSKKEYGSFGLPTVVESPRFGSRSHTDSYGDDKVRRRSSSYSQAVVLGSAVVPKKEVAEIAVVKLPVTRQVRALSNFSSVEEEELSKVEETVKEISKVEAKPQSKESPVVSTSIYTIGNFEILDGEDLTKTNAPLCEERVIFSEVVVAEVVPEPEPEPAPIKKYVPPCSKETVKKPVEAVTKASADVKPQVYHAPHLTAIHYSDDAPVRPEENSLGEKRLVELEFVVGDYIQPLEGKLFYVPRQTVKMYCAPYIHAQDTDFMKESS